MADRDYVPRFSGHETFPFRYGWLTKFTQFVARGVDESEEERSVLEQQMIALGVGKNMVGAMRHWAQASGVVNEGAREVSDLGSFLIGDAARLGVDPYFEHDASLWLIHWRLAGPLLSAATHRTATWYWAFSHFPSSQFTRETLLGELLAAAQANGWPKASKDTLKRDIDCFIGTYAPGRSASDDALEDTIECPLAELGLVRSSGDGKSFEFWNGDKRGLPDPLFAFSVAEYLKIRGSARSLSLEALAFEPGSPGRVFRLGVEDVALRMERLEDASLGRFVYADTAGLRQVQDLKPDVDPLQILSCAYDRKGVSRGGQA
ncbi:MAG: DUF4007 family protein [Pseudomonadota bacterium]